MIKSNFYQQKDNILCKLYSVKTSEITSKADLPNTITQLQNFTWELLLRYQQLQERYALLAKQQYGRRSEKTKDIEAVQEELEDLLAQLEKTINAEAPSNEESVDVITIEKHTRRRRHPGRNVIPEDIEHEEVVHDISPEEKMCDCCGNVKVEISRKKHTVVERIPARYKATVHIRPVYGCPKCKSGISVAEPVVLPIPKGIADVHLLCFVIISKYRYHLPLYRIQRQIFHESRIWFTRSTIVSWLRHLYKTVRRIHYELLGEYKRSPVKHADESPIKVRYGDIPGKHHEGRMWAGVGRDGPGSPVAAVFHYDKSRSAGAAEVFLKGSRAGDVLMVDGCSSYNAPVRKYSLIELNCMAHARRKFVEAFEAGYHKDYCKKIIRKFGQLYRLERFAENTHADTEKRLQLRQLYSKKVVAEIKAYLTNPGFAVLPSNKTGEAINYMLNRWEQLTRFLENGIYPIDNNPVERIIRALAIGRKNWLYAGSESGAKWCAAYYSIFSTCLLNNINPEEYLPDVLMRLAMRPDNADVKDLLPVQWALEKKGFASIKVDYPKN